MMFSLSLLLQNFSISNTQLLSISVTWTNRGLVPTQAVTVSAHKANLLLLIADNLHNVAPPSLICPQRAPELSAVFQINAQVPGDVEWIVVDEPTRSCTCTLSWRLGVLRPPLHHYNGTPFCLQVFHTRNGLRHRDPTDTRILLCTSVSL